MADKESGFEELDPQLVAPLDDDQQRMRLQQLTARWDDEWAVGEGEEPKVPRGGVRLEVAMLDQLLAAVEGAHSAAQPGEGFADDETDAENGDDNGDDPVEPQETPTPSAYDEPDVAAAASDTHTGAADESAAPLREEPAGEVPPVESSAAEAGTDWNLFVVEVLKAYEEERFEVAYSMARRYLEHDPDHEDVQLVMMECQEKLGG